MDHIVYNNWHNFRMLFIHQQINDVQFVSNHSSKIENLHKNFLEKFDESVSPLCKIFLKSFKKSINDKIKSERSSSVCSPWNMIAQHHHF